MRKKENLPDHEGVYLAKSVWGNRENWREVDVYDHPIKGLSVFAEDVGSGGTGVDDETDCHVSIRPSGLIFGRRLRDLD